MKTNLLALGVCVILIPLMTSCGQMNTNSNTQLDMVANANQESPTNQNGDVLPPDKHIEIPGQSDNIRSLSIGANDTISSPLVLSGEAKGWFFEGTFPMKIEDANGNELYTGPVSATKDWMQEGFVPFETRATFVTPTTTSGYIILENDNPSGLPENHEQYKIPVRFALGETTVLQLYFQTSEGLPACGTVFPVERPVAKVTEIGAKAIDELLKGPLVSEREQAKAITAIPAGMLLRSLVIVGKRATVDMSSTTSVPNACQKETIKAQIGETLKQFPTIKTIELKVNGEVW